MSKWIAIVAVLGLFGATQPAAIAGSGCCPGAKATKVEVEAKKADEAKKDCADTAKAECAETAKKDKKAEGGK